MKKASQSTTSRSVDLSNYADKILADEDRPLFDDAVKAWEAGALRAAYVMIWLSCAESLKRRFREAQKRDGKAGKVVGDIESKEKGHNAVDKFLLAKAREYGFITDATHTILYHVYELRCLYAHPYEEAPSQEQVLSAAAVVVKHVLSKPVKLKHGFGKQLISSLLGNRSYLDDQESVVNAFAKDILPRLDESIYPWLLDRYFCELEKISDDSSMKVFFRRGVWFCRAMLVNTKVDVFSHGEWHDRASKYPKTLICVCTTPEVFKEIGERAQDTLVGAILSESATRARVLIYLERLTANDSLSDRQQERFKEHVLKMSIRDIRSAELRTKTCYEKLIKVMKFHNWRVQRPAINLIVSNGPEQAAELDEDQQVNLGRNILQCAEGEENSACQFLEKLSKGEPSWPFGVLRGMALESFTNEDNQIRFKAKYLNQVLITLGLLDESKKERIITEIVTSVNAGKPKKYTDSDAFENVINALKVYPWAKSLVESLEEKAVSIQATEEFKL